MKILNRLRDKSALVATLITVTACVTSPASLAGSAQWSSTNIQYLYGDSYAYIYFDEDAGKLTSRDKTASVVTLEHANAWKYGDNFFFVDITNMDRTDPEVPTGFYGEISPRLSIGKIAGKDLSFGIIKDVLVTTTAEVGEGFHSYLYGLAVDLNIPKTPVAQVNYYIRNDIGRGTGQQVTLVWLTPFDLGSTAWVFEGFFDYAFGMDYAEDNIITGPRLLLDLGKTWGAPDALQVGIEYQMWRNKYGLDGIDEDVAQAMVKWIW